MADEVQSSAPGDAEGTEPHGEGEQQEPDYKALYEQAKANSRKWEKQACQGAGGGQDRRRADCRFAQAP